MTKRTLLLTVLGLAQVLLLQACVSHSGDVFVSPVSTTRWDHYRDQFQPKFDLSEAEALAMAVPTTTQVEQSALDSLSVAAKVKALDGAFDEGDTVEGVDPSGLSSPGTAPTVTAAKEILDAKTLDIDPRLRYLLATALWQEVQVLNRYVVDAAVRRRVQNREFIPYVVRLQLSNHPDSVQSSYLTEINLHFSSTRGTPIVVPLLINDHVEAVLASRRDEEIRRVALSLAALFKGVGANVNMDSFRGELNRSLSRELNSLLSVASVSEDHLRVRLGARRVGDDTYRATSEPHYMTVLILMPSGARGTEPSVVTPIEIQKKEFKIAHEEGEPNNITVGLLGPQGSEQKAEVRVRFAARLIDPINGRDRSPGRNARLSGSFRIEGETLKHPWLREVQTALAYDDGTSTTVTLNDAVGMEPSNVVATWFFRNGSDETIHALSSGEVSYNATHQQLVFNFPSLRRLNVTPTVGEIPSRYVRYEIANDTKADPINTLDSKGKGLPEANRTAIFATDERSFMVKFLDKKVKKGDWTHNVYLFYPWIYKAAKAELKAGPKLTVNRDKVAQSDQKATVNVNVVLPNDATKKPVQGFKLLVSGSDSEIKEVSPADAAANPANGIKTHFDLKKSCTISLELRGLYKDAKVTLSVTGPKGYAVPEPITLTVIN